MDVFTGPSPLSSLESLQAQLLVMIFAAGMCPLNEVIDTDVTPRGCAHFLIDLQAQREPLAPAVICQDTVISYAELVARANQLANYLLATGVGPETLVGLCVERSVDMIVGVLGILKAGAAFVPLDPMYPTDRLAFMVDDSGAPIIIAQKTTCARIPAFTGRVLLIEDSHSFSSEPPTVTINPRQLAYVVYTSGSTGRPKGVMIEHHSLVSFLAWTGSRFTRAQMSRVLCSSSLSFDVAFFEIFAPLAAGGALVIVRDALALLEARPSEPVTTISTVASALAELVRAKAIPPTVTTILQAGEYLPQALARDIYATSNVEELINLCGATEDTIYSVSYDVPKNPTEDPPIGMAFLDRVVYVLDEQLNPVSPGTPGEICYAGTGVARGYHNRPELTAERFVANPFGHSPKMYRSGDLAVEGPDGNIRYLKRNDQQVKISGHRIELGEIEAVLREHPGVDQVAVLARDVSGHKTLAAYAVERPQAGLSVDVIQAFVAERLPEYMVPSTLILLDSMPYGPSGKLDRGALQKLERRRPELALAYQAPRNAFEAKIAQQVAQLLGLDRVGVHDNFFELGGQSLLAARLVSEVQDAFPHEVLELDKKVGEHALLTAFFTEPTVESLAVALAQGVGQLAPSEVKTPNRFRWVQSGQQHRHPLFLFHGVIRGEAFYVWNLAQRLGADQPLYSLAPHGYQGEQVPETIEDMAREYLTQIRHIQPEGPYHFAGYCNGGLVAFEIARMLEAAGETVETLVLISASALNVRFAGAYSAIEALRKFPGMTEARRRSLFLRIRGRLLALENEDGTLPASFIGKLRRVLRRSEGHTCQQLAPEFAQLSRQERDEARYHAFLRAIDAYMPKPYKGKMSLIWGKDDQYGSSDDPYNGWRAVNPSVTLHMVPGDHNFLESRPDLISDHVRSLLASASEEVHSASSS